MQDFLQSIADARDLTDVNIAAGMFAQRLTAQKAQKITRLLWAVVIALLLSDFVPFGPLDIGLVPDELIFQWLTGHPVQTELGHALYHVDKLDHPHFLGVSLPWGDLF